MTDFQFTSLHDGTFPNEPDPDDTRNWVLRELLAQWRPSSVERLAALVDEDVKERCERYDRVVATVEQADSMQKMLAPVQEILDQLRGYEVSHEVALDPQRRGLGGLQSPSPPGRSGAQGVCVSEAPGHGLSLPGPGSSLRGY